MKALFWTLVRELAWHSLQSHSIMHRRQPSSQKPSVGSNRIPKGISFLSVSSFSPSYRLFRVNLCKESLKKLQNSLPCFGDAHCDVLCAKLEAFHSFRPFTHIYSFGVDFSGVAQVPFFFVVLLLQCLTLSVRLFF